MARQPRTMISIALGLSLFSLPVISDAGWGDLLKKIEDSAPELLQKDAETSSEQTTTLDADTLARGLKQALQVGTQRAVNNVSQADGYFANPAIKIPLPETIAQASTLLRRFGMGTLVAEFELSINRAAEQAAPQASEYFVDTLNQMSIDDAKQIYQGGDDAATRYFQERTSTQLEKVFQPAISQSLEQVGATRYYQALVQQASQYPLVGDLDLNLAKHVTRQALEGLFLVLAAEEKKIRQDPVARSTELLKQVFSQ